jgi:ribosomal protein S1
VKFQFAPEEAKWNAVQETFKNAEWLSGAIIKTVKSGFLVGIGVSAFLRILQLCMCFIKEPEKYVDKEYKFIIVEFDRKNQKK